jgi:MioC protein
MALFGTESGNAEEIAFGIRKALREYAIEAVNMADADPGILRLDTFYLIICSTHSSGELPGFAQFLHDDLQEVAPDLTGLRYAMFGLGDTSYEEKYNRGSRLFDELLASLGATRVGTFGEHDVLTRLDHVALGIAWARQVIEVENLSPSA